MRGQEKVVQDEGEKKLEVNKPHEGSGGHLG